jgi:DNA replication licensing factor MCM4
VFLRDALLEKEQEFRDMVADQEAHYQNLKASIAPKVIQMDEVKEGLLCQLFGGVAKTPAAAAGGGGSRASTIRGDINVLVVGDPSVSKSQLLGFVHLVAPRGVYTSGKGSSAVGLTAYVTKVGGRLAALRLSRLLLRIYWAANHIQQTTVYSN